uniref:Neurotrophin-3 n=1 Tax=Hippocampus comes TaxID=109280 RepID=A0A3Q3DCK5_HIPCM
ILHSLMSILLYVMVLVYLYGIQATDMDNSRQGQHHQQGKSRRSEHQDAPPASAEQGRVMMLLNSDLLRQHKRFNSPRVLLSDRAPLQPPPLYMADDFVSGGPEGETSANKTRKKRYTEHKSYRGEYSVCDSESQWVTDKTQAVDTRGTPVTVLDKIKTSAAQDIKQYFYETRCRTPRPFKGGCRGIDDKNWNSQCKTTQTYVRALTQVRNSVGWRWIRIDTSCVCALSRKRHRT